MEVEGYIIHKDVYLATDGGEYTVKEASTNRDPMAWLNERMFLSILDHENIIECIDVIHNDSKTYLVTPTLEPYVMSSDRTYATRLSEDSIKDIAWDILLALDYMHSNSIAHRDIKPSNIMLTSYGHVKVTDMRQCKHFYKCEANTYTDVQSASHRSPEVEDGVVPLGTKTDIYSLWLLILDLFHGRMTNTSPASYAISTMQDMISSIDATDDAKDVIRRSTIANAHDRPSTGYLLHHRWFDGRDVPKPSTVHIHHPRISYRSKTTRQYRSMCEKIASHAHDMRVNIDAINMCERILSYTSDDMVRAALFIAAKQVDEAQYHLICKDITADDMDDIEYIYQAMGYNVIIE